MEFRATGPEAGPVLVLAHGAGAGMDAPAMAAAAEALGAAGLRVLLFEFAYMAARREGRRPPPPKAERLVDEARAALVAAAGAGPVLAGGKSLGGRVFSLIADAERSAGRMRGLVCLGYPFHPRGRPERTRTAHLATLATPTLICQGTRDPLGSREEVAGYALSPAIEMLWLEDGDHDLAPRLRVTGLRRDDHLRSAARAVAEWAGRQGA